MFGSYRIIIPAFRRKSSPLRGFRTILPRKVAPAGPFFRRTAPADGLTFERAHSIISPVHALVAQLDRASDSDSEGRRFESCRVHHRKSLDFIEKIRAFFLCVHILFFELGDCFGDYTQKNRLRGGIVQPCAKVFTNTEKRPPRWRPRPLEARANLHHLDGGERSGHAYTDPEDCLKHPVRLPCAGCWSSCAACLSPRPPASWSAPPKSHQRPGLPRWRCVPRRAPGGCARRRSS